MPARGQTKSPAAKSSAQSELFPNSEFRFPQSDFRNPHSSGSTIRNPHSIETRPALVVCLLADADAIPVVSALVERADGAGVVDTLWSMNDLVALVDGHDESRRMACHLGIAVMN